MPTYAFPTERYGLITISFYRATGRFPDSKETLVPGGCLFVEHHPRSTNSTPFGPSSDRYRFAANELLHACLDLIVLYYSETSEEDSDSGRGANTSIVARKTTGLGSPILLDNGLLSLNCRLRPDGCELATGLLARRRECVRASSGKGASDPGSGFDEGITTR